MMSLAVILEYDFVRSNSTSASKYAFLERFMDYRLRKMNDG